MKFEGLLQFLQFAGASLYIFFKNFAFDAFRVFLKLRVKVKVKVKVKYTYKR